MLKSEYIIWKCETISQIKRKHPEWNDEQVYDYFSKVEAICLKQLLKEKGILK